MRYLGTRWAEGNMDVAPLRCLDSKETIDIKIVIKLQTYLASTLPLPSFYPVSRLPVSVLFFEKVIFLILFCSPYLTNKIAFTEVTSTVFLLKCIHMTGLRLIHLPIALLLSNSNYKSLN